MKSITTYQALDGRAFISAAECEAYEAGIKKKQTEQYKLSYVFKIELRQEFKPKYRKCEHCRGEGKVNSNHGDPTPCDRCFGTGSALDYSGSHELVNPPEIPSVLKERLAKVWDEYWASNDKL
jgi:RecJ-like exonuclease